MASKNVNLLDPELKSGKWSVLYYDILKLVGKHKDKDGKNFNIGYPDVCLLSIIISLNNVKNGVYCTAKNFTFSEIMNTKERQIQVYLKHLKDLGVIYTFEEHVKGSHCTTKRTIYVNYNKILKIVYNKPDKNASVEELYSKTNNETRNYIDKFLQQCNKNCDYKKYLQEVLNPKDVDVEIISRHIKNMTYKEFINTIYWKCVAYEKKHSSGFLCQVCNSKDKLNVHHRTYEHHGEEHKYIDTDLICLCEKCHSLFHNKDKE